MKCKYIKCENSLNRFYRTNKSDYANEYENKYNLLYAPNYESFSYPSYTRYVLVLMVILLFLYANR